MGNIHTMTEILTITEVAETHGRKPDTLWRKAKRTWPDRKWSLYSAVTEDEGRILLADEKPTKGIRSKSPTIRKPRQVETKPEAIHTPAPQKPGVETPPARQAIKWPTLAQIRNIAISCILIAVVLCHAGLIWYDCSQLWGDAGLIGGGAVFLIVLAAVMLAADQSHYATSEAALWFVFFVDCAAWWVHEPVFNTPIVSDTITGSLCAFLCASSWMALYLFRAKNIE